MDFFNIKVGHNVVMHHQQLRPLSLCLCRIVWGNMVWSPNFWYAEINGNGAIVISQAHSAKIWPRMRGGCGVSWRAVKRKALLVAWTRGNPRNYYLHYSHDNAANSCPIDETEWAPLPIEFDYAHTQGRIEGESENIIRRRRGKQAWGMHSYK